MQWGLNMLKDLKVFGDELSDSFKSNFKHKDFILSDTFKKSYSDLIKNQGSLGYKKVSFHKYSAEIETNTGKTFSVPNYWFSAAAHFAPYINELSKYKEAIDQITQELSLPRDWAKEKKIPIAFESLAIENKDYLKNFITDYEWWRGGKTIDRNDYYISPILKLGNFLAETQSGLAEICWQLAHIDDKAVIQNICQPFLDGEKNHTEAFLGSHSILSKPFVLLAGISGTGKSRFVRKQAEDSDGIVKNYKLISVRPDWHEPSDLLGYISRIKEEKYIVTDALKFMVSAWCDACDLVNTSEKVLTNKAPAEMNTFWLCLDEMNLAPVEQYFADYLSVIETRKWDRDSYSCDAILKADTIKLLSSAAATNLRNDLGLTDIKYDSLWSYFSEIGIPLPPNLIVAGTVNMDETTHGFSRKVIDRALTLDFGQFFPNDFDAFFEPTSNPVIFSFPTLSQATQSDFSDVTIDPKGEHSLKFLKGLNEILKGTMFELAYRALNELFISVICIKPKSDIELQAVWDDFLMTKVLPRIEGDDDKLKIHNDSNNKEILKALDEYIKQKLPLIYETELRPDFFRIDATSNNPVEIKCRSRAKLKWMSDRLANNGFTTFWP